MNFWNAAAAPALWLSVWPSTRNVTICTPSVVSGFKEYEKWGSCAPSAYSVSAKAAAVLKNPRKAGFTVTLEAGLGTYCVPWRVSTFCIFCS